MEPGVDGGLELHGAEARRRAEEDHIDAALDHFLIGIEPDELAVADVDFGGRLVAQGTGNVAQLVLDDLGIEIRDRVEFAIVIRQTGLTGGATSTAAHADEADLELFVVLGHEVDVGEQDLGGGGGTGRGPDEAATAGGQVGVGIAHDGWV